MQTDSRITDPVEESKRIVSAAQDGHVTLRLIGGLGIRFHCHGEHSEHLREYHDIDLFGLRKELKGIGSDFPDLGYSPNMEFNLLYGDTGLQFIKEGGRSVDVFLDKLEKTLQRYLKVGRKRLRWKIRGLIGERIKWYQQVEVGEGET